MTSVAIGDATVVSLVASWRNLILEYTITHKQMTELIPKQFRSVIPPPELPKITSKTIR